MEKILIYRSQTTTQTKNSNLDYLIDPAFRNINRLFILSFKNGSNIQQEILLISVTCHQ